MRFYFQDEEVFQAEAEIAEADAEVAELDAESSEDEEEDIGEMTYKQKKVLHVLNTQSSEVEHIYLQIASIQMRYLNNVRPVLIPVV